MVLALPLSRLWAFAYLVEGAKYQRVECQSSAEQVEWTINHEEPDRHVPDNKPWPTLYSNECDTP